MKFMNIYTTTFVLPRQLMTDSSHNMNGKDDFTFYILNLYFFWPAIKLKSPNTSIAWCILTG